MKHGFCIIPSVLLRAQQRLGLNPSQLAVLLRLADYWWDSERKPYPSKQKLHERLGISPRQIQQYIAELEAAGLVKRVERRAAGLFHRNLVIGQRAWAHPADVGGGQRAAALRAATGQQFHGHT